MEGLLLVPFHCLSVLISQTLPESNKPSGERSPPQAPPRTSSLQRGRPHRRRPDPQPQHPGSRRPSNRWQGWPPRGTGAQQERRTSGRGPQHRRA